MPALQSHVTRIPRFKSHLNVRISPPDLVFFLQESGYRAIQGRLPYLIAPLIDGKRSVSQIATLLNGKVSAEEVEWGILLLEAEGHVIRTKHGSHFSAQNNEVQVVCFGNLPLQRAESILSGIGFRISANAKFSVVLVDDYLCEDLEEFNRNAILTGKQWLIAKPVGQILWIGPLFSSPRTGCWRCLAERLKEKHRVENFLRQHGEEFVQHEAPPVSLLAFDIALNLASLEILKKEIDNRLLTFDVPNSKLEKHSVARRADCIDCGVPTQKFPSPIVLKKHKDRTPSIEQTFQKYERHISFRTGIVDQMQSYSNGLIHSVAADHLFVQDLPKKDLLQKGLTHKSWGKGRTLQQAKTGALCEALERYSGLFRGNEFRIRKSYNEIRDKAIPVNNCANFSDEQFKNREKWNRLRSDHDWIPVPLDPRKEIEWTPVWSLTSKIFKYLPTAYCYYGYRLPSDHYFCRADSNGNAAGNTLDEAILNGFLEIVERDSAALWWYNRADRPAVDLESFDQPYIHELRNSYSDNRRDLWVLDITSDFEIPCFVALSATKESVRPEFFLGLGAHFDPLIALTRALTEMNQLLLIRLYGGRKESTWRKIADESYLRPNPALPQKAFKNYPRVNGDVKTCIRLARQRGLEILVLDQTRPDVELPVAKTIVPGMRQAWARFAKGRLYDVPVQLGWLQKPLKENQLNRNRFLI
ncbi:TOMM precursor leader peptide-binding protein [bacterium]|nr:TOMM precursor leader peptide-binding protein [bacterium]MCI0605961.1 TOMM precursor leader peptide-binding protein [bacterium]